MNVKMVEHALSVIFTQRTGRDVQIRGINNEGIRTWRNCRTDSHDDG